MLANDSSLSIHNPILVYSFLAVYGLLTVVILAYVYAKFRFAAKALSMLDTEWKSAEAMHAGFVGKAQQQISKLSVPVPPPVRQASITGDMRKQVVAMGKKGLDAIEIAKACGLHEGEVDVLLGMARLRVGAADKQEAPDLSNLTNRQLSSEPEFL